MNLAEKCHLNCQGQQFVDHYVPLYTYFGALKMNYLIFFKILQLLIYTTLPDYLMNQPLVISGQ